MKSAVRHRLMNRWWGWWTLKPVWLQNGVGRVMCRVWGHEYSRSRWCDYCGREWLEEGEGMMDVHSWEPDERLVMDWAEHNAHAGDGEEARAEAEAEAAAAEAPYMVVSRYVSDTGGMATCSVHDGSLRIPGVDTGQCHVFAEFEVCPRLGEDQPSTRLACAAHLATVCEHLLGEPV